MLHTRTHIMIDGKLHHIAEVQEHDGVRHTHRVHTGCGLTVDVDHRGERHLAAAAEHRANAAKALVEENEGLHEVLSDLANHSEMRAKAHIDDVLNDKGRWRTHEKGKKPKADCAECARVEKGDAPLRRKAGFNPPARPPGG